MKKLLPDVTRSDATDNMTQTKGILINILKMVVILVAAVLLSEILQGLRLGAHNTIMIYLLSVLLISYWTPTYIYGILAAVISALAYDFFVTLPRLHFSIGVGSPITLGIMLTVTFLTSTIAMQLKNQAKLASDREKHAHQMYEINQRILAARDIGSIVQLTEEYLVSHLDCPVIFYTADPVAEPSAYTTALPDGDPEELAEPFLSDEEKKRVHLLFRIGEDDARRPELDVTNSIQYIPVVSSGKVLGVVGIDYLDREPSQGTRMFLQTLIGQAAVAMELQKMSDEQGSIVVEAEKEKMRGTLLRSISHDLRTPLTSILGASSTILEQQDMERSTVSSLAQDIKENTQWLIRMVENILIITRISGENLKVHKTVEAAEEVVSQSAELVRKRFPDYMIHVHIPDEVLMVPMDATLISQVLINLLENAVKNSPVGSLILLSLKKQDDNAIFDVNDNGSGIPEHLLDNLFEVHSPTKEQAVDASRGMGIGLSICRTIIQAHGGSIQGSNRDKGGARFTFRLPLQGEAAHE